MAHTKIHKLEGKFNRKLLPNGKEPTDLTYWQLGQKYPLFVRKKWNRHNFDKAYFLALRKKLIEKIAEKEMDIDLQLEHDLFLHEPDWYE